MSDFLPPLRLKPLSKADIASVVSAFATIGWTKPAPLFEAYLEEQNCEERCVWLAFREHSFVGYVTLKWVSDYPPFREAGIPEIADLNVLPSCQGQGRGSRLIQCAEEEAFQTKACVGMGVGLSAAYGNAQKLYIKRGYIPDGRGDDLPLSSGAPRRIRHPR